LTALVTQLAATSSETSKSVAVLQSGVKDSLQSTQDKVVTPVAGLSTRMDQMSDSLSKLGNAVSDLTSLLNKMQLQLTDLSNAVKLLPTPAPAPPPAVGGAPSAAAAPAAPPISATDLYNNADRDRNGGHYDLAAQEFSDYLKYYGDTAQAASAQFYLGWIHYGQATASKAQEDFQTAAQDFQNVVDKYPDDAKRVPEAMYYKGLSLERMTGHKTEASDEFKTLIKEFPKGDNADKACKELQGLGLRCPTAAATKPAVRKK
jgi:TolA-binding protein